MTATTNTTPKSSLRYALRVLLLGALYFFRALPLSAVAAFPPALFVYTLENRETAGFADFIRAIQEFRTDWLPFTVVFALVVSIWKLALGSSTSSSSLGQGAGRSEFDRPVEDRSSPPR